MDNTKLISVIIVNYNAGEYLLRCVASVLLSKVPLEILVMDNGSHDDSIKLLREKYGNDERVRIFENNANLGFSRGNNAAMPHARGDYLLFLNPDCTVTLGVLAKMLQVMEENPKVGMSGCLIRNSDGSIQPTCIRNTPTPWKAFVRALNLNKLFPQAESFHGLDIGDRIHALQPITVDAISGAFMFVRREALEQVGLLDESYFLYGEDLDWMYRFNLAGWQILFVPGVEIYHAKGVCGTQRPRWVLLQKHRAMARFCKKFFHDKYPLPLMWLIYLGIWLRLGVLSLFTLRGKHEKDF